MRPIHFAFSLAATILIGCAADHSIPTSSTSATVLTGAYTATVLSSPSACGFASAINASGAVAGTTCSVSAEGQNAPLAWSATSHAMTLLPSPTPFPNIITGIADNGTIVGNHFSFSFDVSEALEWKNGAVHPVDRDTSGIGGGGEQNTFANFICATDCTIVGYFRAAPTSPHPPGSKGAIWTTDGFRVDVAAPAGSYNAAFVAIGGGFIFGNISDENGALTPARFGAHGWELLPIPTDASALNSFVTGANIRGDAIGLLARSGTNPLGVLWPSSGDPVEMSVPTDTSGSFPYKSMHQDSWRAIS